MNEKESRRLYVDIEVGDTEKQPAICMWKRTNVSHIILETLSQN